MKVQSSVEQRFLCVEQKLAASAIAKFADRAKIVDSTTLASAICDSPLSPFGRRTAFFRREYLREIAQRKKPRCLGYSGDRQFRMLHQLLFGVGNAEFGNPFAE